MTKDGENEKFNFLMSCWGQLATWEIKTFGFAIFSVIWVEICGILKTKKEQHVHILKGASKSSWKISLMFSSVFFHEFFEACSYVNNMEMLWNF